MSAIGQYLRFRFQQLDKLAYQRCFVFQAGVQLCDGAVHLKDIYLSRSRTLPSRPSAMRLGSILSCPDAMASRSSWTRATLMSLSAFSRLDKCLAALLRSTDGLPLAAAPEGAFALFTPSVRVPALGLVAGFFKEGEVMARQSVG